ncbi:TMEM175 family protein [Nonomuraea sp. B12E4]|uniref:TMEM175 family protein n=1 Tax=Nonomuraea sp. B12E4 TaxID=3153564 RepID=UPI00325CB93B
MPPTVNRPPERLTFFSDAVVAIALTLLVLPLADAIPEAVAAHTSSIAVVTENGWKIFSFLISFGVIARLWIFHHRLFERVKAYNHQLVMVNLCWLLTIAVIPFPTEMIGGFNDDRFTATFYIATVLASNVCQLAMIMIIRADPDIAKHSGGVPARQLFDSIVATGLLVLALALAALIPGIGAFSLLVLLLGHPASWILDLRETDAAQAQ